MDQWDWEKVITAEDRNLDYLKDTVRKIWKVIRGAGQHAQELFPELKTDKYPDFPEELDFLHAEEILDMYPDLPRKQRETRLIQEHPAVFIIGIGWVLEDGYPHEMRAADYDDWVTETTSADGRPMHGLNGDILVWNPVTKRRHELTSMGIRVTKETLSSAAGDGRPARTSWSCPTTRRSSTTRSRCRIGGGIGQSRTYMYLLRTAHLGEVTVTVWPKQLKEICAGAQHPRAGVGAGLRVVRNGHSPPRDHAAASVPATSVTPMTRQKVASIQLPT